ncbi:MAG: FAD-binding oxidoreductase [Burkholderiales bacterium]
MGEKAIDLWREVLGADRVIDDPIVLSAAGRATFAHTNRIGAILKAQYAAEVRAVVRIAAETNSRLYPISRGRNWGLGSKAPSADGCALVDLSGMDRILDYDEKFGTLTVEPGVSFRQAADFLRENNSPFFCSVPGGSPEGSLIGNALERGGGDGPYGDRAAHITALEVVLSTGEIVHTGFDRFEGASAATLARSGVGPSLIDLFFQSNFGIVTRGTVFLAKKPAAWRGVQLRIASTEALAPAIDALRVLLQDGAIHSHSVTLWNSYKLAARAGRYPWSSTQGRTPLDMRARFGAAHWHGSVAIHAASEALAEAALAHTREVLKPGVLDWKEAQREQLPPQDQALAEPGNPTGANVASVYWRKKSAAPPVADADPDRDRCGVIWMCPALPLEGAVVAQVIAGIEQRILAHGFEPNIGMNPVSPRVLDVYVSLMYDREVAGEDEKAMRCHDDVMNWLITEGHLPSRLGIQSMGLLPSPRDDSGAVWSRLKRAFDAAGVIAPGRYECGEKR